MIYSDVGEPFELEEDGLFGSEDLGLEDGYDFAEDDKAVEFLDERFSEDGELRLSGEQRLKMEIIKSLKEHCERKSRATNNLSLYNINRDDWIRTSDPFVPNEVRYQAALHPATKMAYHTQHNMSRDELQTREQGGDKGDKGE